MGRATTNSAKKIFEGKKFLRVRAKGGLPGEILHSLPAKLWHPQPLDLTLKFTLKRLIYTWGIHQDWPQGVLKALLGPLWDPRSCGDHIPARPSELPDRVQQTFFRSSFQNFQLPSDTFWTFVALVSLHSIAALSVMHQNDRIDETLQTQ